MKDKQINLKKQILSYINKLNDVSIDNLTVAELKEQFKTDIDIYDKKVSDAEELVKNEFKDVYLKKYSDKSIFGKELEVFHVKSIEYECYDTDYVKNYKIDGTRISFNGINTNIRELSANASDLMSEKELRACIVITKEHYDAYMDSCIEIKNMFEKIVTE